MTNAGASPVRPRLGLFIQGARPFSFSASVSPVLIAGMIALNNHPAQTLWFILPVTLICAVLFHAGTNLVSEYYDLKKGVDRVDTFGSSRVLVDNLLEPASVMKAGILCLSVGFILGLLLVYYRGPEMLLLGLIGLLGAYFYTAEPVGFKYIALGDIGVFTMFGPLMVLGANFALTGVYDPNAIIISIPVGFLVIAILHANNTRDIMHDSEANIKTFAMLVGINGSKLFYYFLQVGAYLAVVTFVILKITEPWALLVFLALPVSIKNMKEMSGASIDNPKSIAILDIKTAQNHMQFGLLLAIGLLLSALV
jgi:1,4-dihydroxy-2-naphthoate octaprenyltransferase